MKLDDVQDKLPPAITIVIMQSDGVWFAQCVGVPGCVTEADSPSAALDAIEDAVAAWLLSAHETAQGVHE